MTPAAGTFTINEDWSTLAIGCPECDDDGRTIAIPYGATIRDLINAASEHARVAHPLSEPSPRTAVWTQ